MLLRTIDSDIFCSALSCSTVYRSVPCWLRCSWKNTAVVIISNRLSGYGIRPPLPEKPPWTCIVPRLEGRVGITTDVLYAGGYTTSVSWPSFFLFHSALFANVPCLVANRHGSVWGSQWVIAWMGRQTEGNYLLSAPTRAACRLNSLVRRHQ